MARTANCTSVYPACTKPPVRNKSGSQTIRSIPGSPTWIWTQTTRPSASCRPAPPGKPSTEQIRRTDRHRFPAARSTQPPDGSRQPDRYLASAQPSHTENPVQNKSDKDRHRFPVARFRQTLPSGQNQMPRSWHSFKPDVSPPEPDNPAVHEMPPAVLYKPGICQAHTWPDNGNCLKDPSAVPARRCGTHLQFYPEASV